MTLSSGAVHSCRLGLGGESMDHIACHKSTARQRQASSGYLFIIKQLHTRLNLAGELRTRVLLYSFKGKPYIPSTKKARSNRLINRSRYSSKAPLVGTKLSWAQKSLSFFVRFIYRNTRLILRSATTALIVFEFGLLFLNSPGEPAPS